MPFSKYPQVSTYQTKRFNFIGVPQQRDGTSVTKDQRFLNCFPELIKSSITEGKKYYLRKRAGLAYDSTTSANAEGRGLFYWNATQFAVIGDTVYKDGTAFQTLSTSTGTVGFTEYNGTQDYLILLDGTDGYTIDTSFSISRIADADFPTPHLPYPVAMDGYLFVAKAGTADIYNSDLEDPASWTNGNFITAEMYPDTLSRIVKDDNYLCAIGTSTVEYFYDAGNASGSPLQRNDSGVQQFGSISPDTVVSTDKELLLVGTTDNGDFTVWSLDAFKATQIAIEAVIESLSAEGTSITGAHAMVLKSQGHKFYILNLTSRTWVYDFDEKMWHEWSYGGESAAFCCNFCADKGTGKPFLLHKTNGNILSLDPSVYSDHISSGSTTSIHMLVVTLKVDFDTVNRKFMNRFSLLGDSPNGNTSTSFSISWSDDDYVTWSTQVSLGMTGNYGAISQLGSFRRRGFAVRYTADYPVRLEGFEVDINLGQI